MPTSLYEAQLLCRTGTVIADFEASLIESTTDTNIIFSSKSQGNVTSYSWDFGMGASPATASGIGPHNVSYSSEGKKTATLTVSNGTQSHTERKIAYINIAQPNLLAVNDAEMIAVNSSVSTNIISNDLHPTNIDNYALVFDGIDDKVVLEGITVVNEFPFTLSAWYKTTSSDYQYIVYNGRSESNITGNSISMDNGHIILESFLFSGSVNQTQIIDPATTNDGNWHHVVAIYESATSRLLYVDGILKGTDTDELNNLSHNLNRFSVGIREDATPNNFFTGEIDEIRVYQGTLSLSDVNELMLGKDCSTHEKVLNYNFDDQPTSVVIDNFNFYDAALTGATSVVSDSGISGLRAMIVSEPSYGNASFTDNFEITYQPDTDFTGFDSLTYQLTYGDCITSQATISYQVGDVTWSGATNNDWNTASNWNTNIVPDSSHDVLIPNALSNYPTIASGSNIIVNSISMDSGASLLIDETATLSGTLTYNRTLNTDNWYLIGIPVEGETIEDMIVNNNFDIGSGGNIGFAMYDNNQATNRWDYQNMSSTGSLTFGQGYSIKLASPGLFKLSGTASVNDDIFTMSAGVNGHRFNLLGNPYPSYLGGKFGS